MQDETNPAWLLGDVESAKIKSEYFLTE